MAETQTLLDKVKRMIELLELIESHTRPEELEEKKSTITGFSAGDKK